jgi:endo-1,3(4)-beta-glucanase
MSVSHIDRKQLAYGPGTPARYFINPVGIKSFIFSAAELANSTVLTTSALQTFSVNVGLAPAAGMKPIITFPLVQGMGTVTAVYTNATVVLQSGVLFREFMFVGEIYQSGTYKYRVILQDRTMWMMYVTPTGSAGTPPFTLVNNTSIEGPGSFTGTIQIGKNPITSTGEFFFDNAAGTYATGATISGSVMEGTRNGSYTISWKKGGRQDQSLLMFALPHHLEALDPASQLQLAPVKLQTTTKGMAQAITSDSMTLLENNLPVDIGFDPWSPRTGSVSRVSDDAAAAINSAAAIELAQDISGQSNLNSMYYSGKVIHSNHSILQHPS